MSAAVRPEREVIVIGYGFEYLVMALNCADSIRRSNPGLVTTLITNVPIDPVSVAERFDRIVVRDEPSDRNRLVKTSVLDHSVAQKVLYVDADGEVVGDLDPAFRLLDRFDVGLKSHAVPVNKAFDLADGIPGGVFPHLAGGMLLLRDGPAARAFLAHWQRRMVESGLSRDQPALARTVYDLPDLRLIVLNGVWLADDLETHRLFGPKHEQPRILHYAHPHEAVPIAHRLRAVLEELLPLLPDALRQDPEVDRVREKYRRITHPLFAPRLTRRAYLFAAHRIGRLRGHSDVDVLDRAATVSGRAYAAGAGRLWED